MRNKVFQQVWLSHVKPRLEGFDWVLVLAIVLLATLGLVAMYSSGMDNGARFGLHLRNIVLACGIIFVVAQVPPQRIVELAVPLYTVGVLLLIAVALFGIVKKGSRRWINVGIVIQPSEIMKIATPLMLAWWFQKREGALQKVDFIVAGILLLLPVGLIAKQPDLGTALLVFAAGFSVLYFAGLSWRLIVPPVLVGLLVVILLIYNGDAWCEPNVDWKILHEYQKQRICTLLDPYRDPLNKGFHTIQGMIAIGSGGLTGKGFLKGTQTHLEFIPERTTDFIFASYAEEWGFIGVFLLISLFVFLIFRALRIASNATILVSRLMAASVAMIFFTYAFVNMGMVSGILPVVGVPLPFISYGGTALVMLGLALGILMSVARSRKI